MIELKITGETAQEFVNSLLQTTGLIVNGVKNAAAKPAPPATEDQPTVPSAKNDTTQVAEPMDNPKAGESESEKPKKRGRPAKADKAATPPAQIDIETAIAAKPPLDVAKGDAIPDFLKREGDAPQKVFKIDDCRAAMVQLYDNYVARMKALGETDENKIMAGKIAYAKQLVYGFGVEKLTELKPEQMRDFMAAAQGYIDGSTKLADAT